MVRCFVAGATGYVGRAVVDQLAVRGVRTRSIAHVRPDSPRLAEWKVRFAAVGAEVDATPWEVVAMAETLRRHAVTHVFCLIGTTRKRAAAEAIAGDRYRQIDLGLTRVLIEAAVASGAHPTFVYLSSIGADPRARSAYLRARGEAEHLVIASGLPHLIARPAVITGPDREDVRPAERLAAAMGDRALSALARIGARRLRDRWRSTTGREMARSLVACAIERRVHGVVDGATLRGPDRV